MPIQDINQVRIEHGRLIPVEPFNDKRIDKGIKIVHPILALFADLLAKVGLGSGTLAVRVNSKKIHLNKESCKQKLPEGETFSSNEDLIKKIKEIFNKQRPPNQATGLKSSSLTTEVPEPQGDSSTRDSILDEIKPIVPNHRAPTTQPILTSVESKPSESQNSPLQPTPAEVVPLSPPANNPSDVNLVAAPSENIPEALSSVERIEEKLLEAVRSKDIDRCREYLKKGANVNFVDPISGNTLLMEAIKEGSLDLVKLLLPNKALFGEDVLTLAEKERTSLTSHLEVMKKTRQRDFSGENKLKELEDIQKFLSFSLFYTWLGQTTDWNKKTRADYENLAAKCKVAFQNNPKVEMTLHHHQYRWGFSYYYGEILGQPEYVPIPHEMCSRLRKIQEIDPMADWIPIPNPKYKTIVTAKITLETHNPSSGSATTEQDLTDLIDGAKMSPNSLNILRALVPYATSIKGHISEAKYSKLRELVPEYPEKSILDT